ncbi:hypothetical protein RRG08_027478 [Elysia crispata]|uniref:Uncharacterized protein n=1 Tax=Elysia crispata TaxID=231223 RepID=A0AAE0YSX9_9GAST|nr:hypothetical protein RRG08_027478 [Elysia crispata]
MEKQQRVGGSKKRHRGKRKVEKEEEEKQVEERKKEEETQRQPDRQTDIQKEIKFKMLKAGRNVAPAGGNTTRRGCHSDTSPRVNVADGRSRVPSGSRRDQQPGQEVVEGRVQNECHISNPPILVFLGHSCKTGDNKANYISQETASLCTIDRGENFRHKVISSSSKSPAKQTVSSGK